MSARLVLSALLAAASLVHAQTGPSATADSAPVRIGPAQDYDVDKLPDDHYGRLVRYGKELTDRTFAYIGPEVDDPRMRFAGNNLACSSCHQASATKPFAMPWVGAYSSFPQYRAREDEVSTVEERVNGCMERSMAGKVLPLDSREMKAFVTYMHFLSRGVPTGAKVEGQGLPPYSPPNRRADPAAGEKVYQAKCVVCHGADGAGQRAVAVGSAAGYAFPPLWGKDSFNNGAGMARLLFASSFIKTNMPLGAQHGQPQLSDDEAYDVAAFMLSHDRPVKANTERDFPARWNKPVDSPFPPYVTGAPADQHKYGPFGPLQQKMKELRSAQMKANAK
ncbi:MAG: c-type cytochrome [Burkholderiaceae bacterium]|jgi:thiosulfate dehydrogenase|nr:c-type cytochrome [Burkholderiaceae bacterium]